jgi:hypothetical protein
MKPLNKKHILFLITFLLCAALSGCAGVNGAASGNNSGVRASTDIFKW